MLTLYNTLTNKEAAFQSLQEGRVSMYTCGPTVYGRPHIGNYSSFLMADLLRRWLEVSGYEVTHVKNITDVGHLTGDSTADATGEDKIERQARLIAEQERGDGAQVGMDDVLAVSRTYTDQYLHDEQALNMLEPHHRPYATQTIAEMIAAIEELMAKGHAYETDDGVYFDVRSFPEYGKLSGNKIEDLCVGSRVAVDETKKSPADFALWKKCVGHNEGHILRWSSPWGEGFPGWHIECSAMSTKFLGDQIDIHTGGEDNIFPHHECEIAQSEGVSGKRFVKLWLHKRRIDMGSKKMSKSLGNVLTISDIMDMGYSPLDLRYYFLSVHYRTQLKFTEKGLSDARKARKKIVDWITEISKKNTLKSQVSSLSYVQLFEKAMNSDLNTPGALATVFDCMAWSRNHDLTQEEKAHLSHFIDMIRHTFGCFEADESSESLSEDVQALIDQREVARQEKDFQRSDELREAIAELGYEVRDTADGQVVSKM